jgi:hypothetical protein
MGYGGGLPLTQKGRTTWEVFYSGPGLGLPGRRGTRSKKSHGITSVIWEIKLNHIGPERHERVFFRQRTRNRCTALPLSQQG